MSFARVNDIQVYYETRGEGFPLVMINGGNENLDCWDPRLIEALSQEFRLVLFDNRGAGRSGVSDKDYTMALLADDTSRLLKEALGISKAHVLGISMGGMIAQELAISYSELVSKLVLCSTTSRWMMSQEGSRIVSAMEEGRPREELLKLYLAIPFVSEYPSDLIRKDPSIVHTWTAGFVRDHADLVDRYQRRFREHLITQEAASRQFTALRKFSSQERLQQIRAPTLVLHGRKDFVFPPENGSKLASGIPGAKLIFLENSAHYLAEEMDGVIKEILEFLL